MTVQYGLFAIELRKRGKMSNKIIVLGVMFVLCALSAMAIGVGPAYTNLDFQPEMSQQYTITIYNTDQADMDVSLSVEGELSEYITLDEKQVSIAADENSEDVSFNLTLPQDITPGDYTSMIRIRETDSFQNATITTSLSVNHKLRLHVPAHGKYINVDVVDEDSVFVEVENIGLKVIDNLEVANKVEELEIYESQSTGSFGPDEVFTAEFSKDMPSGMYNQEILVKYDNLSRNIERLLQIGEPEIIITDISFSKFTPGEIAQININLSSNWNRPLETVVEGEIDGQLLRSSDFTIEDTSTVSLFWETNADMKGRKSLELNILGAEKMIGSEQYIFEVTKQGVRQVETANNTQQILLITIILLLTTITTLFIYWKLKK